jgi:hypothetical protein
MTYSWQAMHYDRYGKPSEWSGSRAFTTQVDAEDNNSNGIPDEQEIDSLADLDEDGTWDVDQDTIKSIDVGDGKSLGISIKNSSNVVAIESVWAEHQDVDESPTDEAGNPEEFPFGLINFKLIMNQPGDSAEIGIYFSEPAPDNGRWLKYNPIEATWTDFSSQSDFSDDLRFLSLRLEDGGEGDADGIANGIIVDPSGLAVSSSGSESNDSSLDSSGDSSGVSSGDSSGGGGSSGACFIKTAGYEASMFSQWVARPVIRSQVWAMLFLLVVSIVAVKLGFNKSEKKQGVKS